MTIDDGLQELRMVLGNPLPPVSKYICTVTAGNLVSLSRRGLLKTYGPIEGKTRETLALEKGQQAARNSTLNILATFEKTEIGNLNQIRRVMKVLGMINAALDF